MTTEENHPLFEIVQSQHEDKARGIYSVCSSNSFVIEACLKQALQSDNYVLIESTSNQVNQYGGYTGMNPGQFASFVKEIAQKMNFPPERIILGGDHFGPNVWQTENAYQAMAKSRELVASAIRAGFSKIHLDASMKCADDAADQALDVRVSAKRAAEMCRAAEDAWNATPSSAWKPCYVIGTEVPVPGGSVVEENEVNITCPEDAQETIEVTRSTFYEFALEDAWERVVALVVQPGVEFNDSSVVGYQRERAAALSRFIEGYDHLIYEAHSTDYQTPESLKEMVEDHFAILKVGPALTFAFREAVFALEMMEQEWLCGSAAIRLSHLRAVLDNAMVEKPDDWAKYYHGDDHALHLARKYSYSDRSRYYWPNHQVQHSLQLLLHNLADNPIPMSLISQYMPLQYRKIMSGELANNALDLIYDRIIFQILDYTNACNM